MLYVIGGLTTLLVLALPHHAGVDGPVLLALGLTATCVGYVIYRMRHRLPGGVYPWLLACGTVINTVMTDATGTYSAMVSFSFFYTWIVLYAVLFFSPLGVALQLGLVLAGYATVMTRYDNSDVDLLTPFEPLVLVSVIATTTAVVVLLARASEASEIDPLTHVSNRRGLDRTLELALQAAAVDPRLNVAMIDIDHFKRINDKDGHAGGDRVLEQLTASWRPLLRPGDSIGRLGGDEFLVVLPGCSAAAATTILERLRTSSPEGVTCSIGAACWQAGESSSMLVTKADAALYLAKRGGRDRVAWSS
jgi:diguanylate cyclase (GGDEF)-like protein